MNPCQPNITTSQISPQQGDVISWIWSSVFGEDYIYQRNSSWAEPYTFSGKEKDSETGYSYFGARYYDSDLSVWLSVDPLSDKRLGLSSYNYCQLNPIMRIDPTGNIDVEGVGHNRGRISRYKRKAIRMANKSGLNWNNPSDRSQIHSAMREKYKGRRFMYLETGNSNQDHYGGWYTTSSFLDSQDGTQSISYVSKKEKPNLIPTVDDNKSTTWDFEAKGEYGNIYIDIVPYDNGTKTSVPFYFSVFDQDGNEVVKSKNLSKNGVSLHFTRPGSFSIFYSPSEEAQHHDGTDKSKTWSAPVFSVSIINYYQVSKTKQPAIVGSSYVSFRKFLKSERKH
jgi:RHS repeat-associated protein